MQSQQLWLFRNIADLVYPGCVPVCDQCGDVLESGFTILHNQETWWCESCKDFCFTPYWQHALPLFYEMFAQWFSGVKKGGVGMAK